MVAYPSDRQIQLAGAHAFTYDYLYTEESTQVQVYNTCVAPLVGSFFEGYNATILGTRQSNAEIHTDTTTTTSSGSNNVSGEARGSKRSWGWS